MKPNDLLDDIVYVFLMGFVIITFPVSLPTILINEHSIERKEDSFFYPPWQRRVFEKRQEKEKLEAYKKNKTKTYADLYSEAIKH